MYVKKLKLTPTSVLTFRKAPMSYKTISSYFFIPPTVLSGYLYRLIKLANGQLLPVPKRFKSDKIKLSEYFILETKGYNMYSLGAYPKEFSTFESVRMGYQDIDLGITYTSDLIPFRISRIKLFELLEKNKQKFKDYGKVKQKIDRSHDDYRYFKTIENIVHFSEGPISERDIPDHSKTSSKGKAQNISNTGYGKRLRRAPLDWQFVVANEYIGYIIAGDKDELQILDGLKNYGFKIGKEGYAYISEVEKTQRLVEKEGEFISDILIPVESNVMVQKNIDMVYYFNGKSFVRDLFALNGSKARDKYFTTESNDTFIPRSTLLKLGVIT